MNKSNVTDIEKAKNGLNKPVSDLSLSDNSCTESESDDDDDGEDDNDDDEDDYLCNSQVVGLFCDRTFKNVKELFKHELDVNKFNLVEILKKNNMGMIEYIKMINFIRKEVEF